MKKEINKNLGWKLIAILFFLLAVVFFFKGEYEKKQINEGYVDCMIKKNICTNNLNKSLQGWRQSIFLVGYSLNMTDEEIEYSLETGENLFYLNNTGGFNNEN